MSRVSKKRMHRSEQAPAKAEFHRFYLDHIDYVYRFVYFRVGQNRDVAEDLVSEIFMKALKAYEKYDPKQSKNAWIMTIARNHLANWYRDRKQTEDIDEIAFKLEGEDLRDQMEVKSDVDVLMGALGKLKPKERHIIELKHLQGYRFKEIAELLGKTAGAARVECHRAMDKLKKILKQGV